MKIDLIYLIIIIPVIIFFIYLSYYIYRYNKVENITSKIDNRNYEVQLKEDAASAADLIAKIREKLMILADHLKNSYPGDARILRLNQNFNPDNMREGIDNPKYTSYSVNKGEQIVLCLRTKDKLVDINTMMFVVLHELAHIVTVSIGHTEEFWENFKWILEESINIGIYVKQDFAKENVEYCGMTITDTPLK